MKRILGVALFVSALLNAFLLYRVVDLGVTVTYGADQISYQGKQLAATEKLMPLLMPNTSRADLIRAAKESGLETIDKGEAGLYVGNVQFIVSGDRVVAVKFE